MQEETSVLSIEQAGAGVRRLRLAAPGTCASARPGQFVHVRVPALDPGAMRRPISICDAGGGVLTLVFKIVGRGTEALAAVRPGDKVDVLGPLGNGFPVSGPGAAPNSAAAAPCSAAAGNGDPTSRFYALVGGGYGVAPLYFLARELLRLGAPASRVAVFAGGRTAADILLAEDFAALGVAVHPATEDGSLGARGLVTAPLDAWLEAHAPDRVAIYACGPAPMLRALDERAARIGCEAWLSLDRRMACGIGACLGCVQKTRTPSGTETLSRVCVDGPVFPAGTLVW
ncbi:MAG: dihydroorotate dehydrogenase electron transfer subunit [Kiritimatiellae bacterium]|nr:dihydroorotate dehydrogenase electron transfer subunit [Kiritimatiellia bacterium]